MTCVIPSSIADSAIASESSMVEAPSSIPGKMWQCRSTISTIFSSLPPGCKYLPGTEGKQYSSEDLPHPKRLDSLNQFPSQNAAKKHSRDQQQSRLPGDESASGVGQQRQDAGGRDQSD